MIFAYGSGENTAQAFPDVGLDFRMERRVPLSTHAVLYVLDARTGKELWSSGKQIATWNHLSGLAWRTVRCISTLRRHAVLLRIRTNEVLVWRSCCWALASVGAIAQEADAARNWNRRSLRSRRLLIDWAGLTRYGSENTELKLAATRIALSLSAMRSRENWGTGKAKFFPGKPYFNRGIARQTTPQMLVRFRQDVIALKAEGGGDSGGHQRHCGRRGADYGRHGARTSCRWWNWRRQMASAWCSRHTELKAATHSNLIAATIPI